jgi:hypothetical protein
LARDTSLFGLVRGTSCPRVFLSIYLSIYLASQSYGDGAINSIANRSGGTSSLLGLSSGANDRPLAAA